MATTIPAPVYQAQLELLRSAYEAQFGKEAIASERLVEHTRQSVVTTYGRNLRFWEERIPELDPTHGLQIADVARHAICTNAAANVRKRIRELGVEQDVDTWLRTQ